MKKKIKKKNKSRHKFKLVLSFRQDRLTCRLTCRILHYLLKMFDFLFRTVSLLDTTTGGGCYLCSVVN